MPSRRCARTMADRAEAVGCLMRRVGILPVSLEHGAGRRHPTALPRPMRRHVARHDRGRTGRSGRTAPPAPIRRTAGRLETRRWSPASQRAPCGASAGLQPSGWDDPAPRSQRWHLAPLQTRKKRSSATGTVPCPAVRGTMRGSAKGRHRKPVRVRGTTIRVIGPGCLRAVLDGSSPGGLSAVVAWLYWPRQRGA